MAVVSEETRELTPETHGEEWAMAALLSVITEGRPYILIVPEIKDTDNGPMLAIETKSDITEPEAIKAVLESVLEDLK